MSLPYPRPFGDMAGLDGVDRAITTERAVRPYYGRGLYETEHEDTEASAYRRGQVIGLAIMRSRLDALIRGALPDRSLEQVAEWENTLGLPHAPDRWTIDQRWERIQARLREPRGADADSIEDAIIKAAGGDYFIVNNPYAGDTLAYRVRIFNPLVPDLGRCPEWAAVRDTLWRMTPCHVRCYTDWPDLGIADALLT